MLVFPECVTLCCVCHRILTVFVYFRIQLALVFWECAYIMNAWTVRWDCPDQLPGNVVAKQQSRSNESWPSISNGSFASVIPSGIGAPQDTPAIAA